MEVAFRRTVERLEPHFSFNLVEMPDRFSELAPAVDIIGVLCCGILLYLGYNAYRDLR